MSQWILALHFSAVKYSNPPFYPGIHKDTLKMSNQFHPCLLLYCFCLTVDYSNLEIFQYFPYCVNDINPTINDLFKMYTFIYLKFHCTCLHLCSLCIWVRGCCGRVDTIKITSLAPLSWFLTRNYCACTPMLYISELCEDCAVANEIDYA